MELLKSLANPEDRNKLYFNKFRYRSTLITRYLGFIYYTHSITDYREKLNQVAQHRAQWARQVDMSHCDFYLIEKVINFREHHKDRKDVTLRLEHDKLSVFTNDIDILNKVYDIFPKTYLSEVTLTEPGVMLFVKEPAYKYRIYLKSRQVSTEFKEDFFDFVTTNPSVSASPALVNTLRNPRRARYPFMHGGYFLNYNDESTVTLLGLLFPQILGKVYKLEKRPEPTI